MTVSTPQPAPARDDEMEAQSDHDEKSSAAGRNGSARDRRRSHRHEAVPGIGAITLYPEDPAQLLNISSSGLLVSCSRRLMPDTRAKFVLQCNDDEKLVVTGRVVRSKLVAVAGSGGIAYETAICADTELDLEKYGATTPHREADTERTHGGVSGPIDKICVTPGREMPIKVSRLSDDGCFIEQPNRASPGDQLNLEIKVPHGDPIVRVAEVVSAEAETGFSVVFLNAVGPGSHQLRPTTEAMPTGAPVTMVSGRLRDASAQTDMHANDW